MIVDFLKNVKIEKAATESWLLNSEIQSLDLEKELRKNIIDRINYVNAFVSIIYRVFQ